MSNAGGIRRHSFSGFILSVGLVLLACPLFGQQAYVARYDVYGGYAFLDSPHVNLFENGFAMQAGVRPKRWLSFGFDYTRASGDLKLTPGLLVPSLQQSLAGTLQLLAAAGKIPAGYSLVVPAHSVTQTFAVGPQLAYRKMKYATLFLRPVFAGIIHENATPKPADPIASLIVAGLTQSGLLPASGGKTDNVFFYGFGGGFDILFSKHFALRTQADLVHDHLFGDLLKDARFTTRFSVGPAFNFGKNVER
jgi:hypothetical protein